MTASLSTETYVLVGIPIGEVVEASTAYMDLTLSTNDCPAAHKTGSCRLGSLLNPVLTMAMGLDEA